MMKAESISRVTRSSHLFSSVVHLKSKENSFATLNLKTWKGSRKPPSFNPFKACLLGFRFLEKIGENLLDVHYIQDVANADSLILSLEKAQKVVVSGGGYIGMEIAAAAVGWKLDTTIWNEVAHLINLDRFNQIKIWTFRILFDYGKTYLLRIINSIMNEEVFFMVAHHNLRVVGMDGAYVKPFKTNYIMIAPGQAMDVLIIANQSPSHYYMAARAYAGVVYDNTTTTAIVQYSGNYTAPSTSLFPNLPNYTNINAAKNFTKRLRALASKEHPIDVPKSFDTELFMTIFVGTCPCGDTSCSGPNGTRLTASLTNISYEQQEVDILQAYYKKIKGIYTQDFPRPMSRVQIENHPMHLHGFSFYVVGSGFGNFDKKTDPTGFNLVDPPELNIVGVPKNGWAVIRFKANNPGMFRALLV
ncbi:Laccase-14 [Camellia lanceoleosa]|uniref:Laccase-14 n=1 Tax=Camellia lanceoleosa TaxID=1840588 RepID=A0ACC0F452_9ERIC|nr:Laccase-14 [Camellia lanceoleosa]